MCVSQDWAFLARFCFISGRGRYEYEIEFDRRYGEPQLLLYYDDKTQWPSVYKSDKVIKHIIFTLTLDFYFFFYPHGMAITFSKFSKINFQIDILKFYRAP